MLRFSVILVTLFLTAGFAYAADWQYISKYSQADIFIDKSSIVKHGKTVTYWRRYEYYEPQTTTSQGEQYAIKSTKSLIEADCKNNAYEGKSIQAYDEEGRPIGQSNAKQGKEQVVPGSNVESEMAYVCMFNDKYDKEQDDLVNKTIDSFFSKFKKMGMSGVEKNIAGCYANASKVKRKKDLEQCLITDASAYFWNRGFMTAMGLDPDTGFFATDKTNLRITSGYGKLGYSKIQGEVAYSVLLSKFNKLFPSKSMEYANR
jgi:hypothetical protein